jgi:hypothetical protein
VLVTGRRQGALLQAKRRRQLPFDRHHGRGRGRGGIRALLQRGETLLIESGQARRRFLRIRRLCRSGGLYTAGCEARFKPLSLIAEERGFRIAFERSQQAAKRLGQGGIRLGEFVMTAYQDFNGRRRSRAIETRRGGRSLATPWRRQREQRCQRTEPHPPRH